MQTVSEQQDKSRASYAPDWDGTDVRAMSIATSLFFMWGFLTSLNDVMIPNLKAIFDLDFTRAMLVQFAFFSSYFIFALPAAPKEEKLRLC
jgi:FHS family L-fucose permease-like MFS transporter